MSPIRAVLLLTAPIALVAQTAFDFEPTIVTIADWSQTGAAFYVVCDSDISSTLFGNFSLGGNYWRGMPYPMGHTKPCLLTSIHRPLDTPWLAEARSPSLESVWRCCASRWVSGGIHPPRRPTVRR
jgi:hypothetical protein